MITIGISTSLGQMSLVFGEENKVVLQSKAQAAGEDLIQELFLNGMKQLGKENSDVDKILVDIGPGGTSSVRTGVSFANSLAYSLKIPVHPVSSFEITGLHLQNTYELPVVATVKSIAGNALIGIYEQNKQITVHYGKITDLLPKLMANTTQFVVAGFHSEEIVNLFPSKEIINAELKQGNASYLITKQELFANRACIWPKFAHPITEQNLSVLF